jgi:hypothetical protein
VAVVEAPEHNSARAGTDVERVVGSADFTVPDRARKFLAYIVDETLGLPGIGYQFFENPDAFEQLAWTAGVSYDWKAMTFDVRYWDTDLDDDECVARSGFADGCDARIVGTISFNTAWSDFTKGR